MDQHMDPAGPPLHEFMMSFTDGRDSGLLLVSHFSLLTGCAISVWLALSLQPPGMSQGGVWRSESPGSVNPAQGLQIRSPGCRLSIWLKLPLAARVCCGWALHRHRSISGGAQGDCQGLFRPTLTTVVRGAMLQAALPPRHRTGSRRAWACPPQHSRVLWPWAWPMPRRQPWASDTVATRYAEARPARQ